MAKSRKLMMLLAAVPLAYAGACAWIGAETVASIANASSVRITNGVRIFLSLTPRTCVGALALRVTLSLRARAPQAETGHFAGLSEVFGQSANHAICDQPGDG